MWLRGSVPRGPVPVPEPLPDSDTEPGEGAALEVRGVREQFADVMTYDDRALSTGPTDLWMLWTHEGPSPQVLDTGCRVVERRARVS